MHWGSFVACSIPIRFGTKLLEKAKSQFGEFSKIVAWHDPEYLHMTTHFLGWVDDFKIEKVKEIINTTVDIEIIPTIQTLGDGKNEKYLAVSVNNSAKLISTYTAIKTALKEKGIFVKDQKFIPHISLGRIRTEDIQHFENVKLNNINRVIISNLDLLFFESKSKSSIL